MSIILNFMHAGDERAFDQVNSIQMHLERSKYVDSVIKSPKMVVCVLSILDRNWAESSPSKTLSRPSAFVSKEKQPHVTTNLTSGITAVLIVTADSDHEWPPQHCFVAQHMRELDWGWRWADHTCMVAERSWTRSWTQKAKVLNFGPTYWWELSLNWSRTRCSSRVRRAWVPDHWQAKPVPIHPIRCTEKSVSCIS